MLGDVKLQLFLPPWVLRMFEGQSVPPNLKIEFVVPRIGI